MLKRHEWFCLGGLILFSWVVCGWGFYLAGKKVVTTTPEARSPAYVGDQPPGSTVLLVAVMPDNTRVYRIDNQKDMIVPALVAISPSGQMAFSR